MSRSRKKHSYYTSTVKGVELIYKPIKKQVRKTRDIKSGGMYRKIGIKHIINYSTRYTLDMVADAHRESILRGWHTYTFEEQYMDWFRDFYMK